ncbi:MAG: histidine kinase [Halomonadaceae bacterium]|nr:MAG: histidine kinase [Halomonadaceae bacterium]
MAWATAGTRNRCENSHQTPDSEPDMLNLKRQLLLVLLLTLMIPTAGLYFVLDLESALREQQGEQLLARTASLSAQLALQPALQALPPLQPQQPVVYAQPLNRPLFLDGYGDDWPGASGSTGRPPMHDAGDGVTWNAAEDGRYLYLLIRVASDRIHYYAPQSPQRPHDKLVLYQAHRGSNGEDAGYQVHHIRTSAPGPVHAAPTTTPETIDPHIQGVWQEGARGYTLELRLPYRQDLSHLGFQVISPGEASRDQPRGLLGPLPDGLPLLLTRNHTLAGLLQPLAEPGLTVRLLNGQGWQLAQARVDDYQLAEDIWQSGPLAIAQRLAFNGLRALLAWRQPDAMALSMAGQQLDSPLLAASRDPQQPRLALTQGSNGGTSLTALAPVAGRDGPGAMLMLEQTSNSLVTLSSSTLGQVLSRSLLLVMGLALALLGYAGWLSWRIARLRRAVAATVDPQGRLIGTFTPGPRRRDELDDLSHHFAHLLGRLQGYTGYLESFARKLSHELKTPLAIVHSSLDNLGHTGLDGQQTVYQQRAVQGADRLRHILNAMSEASRLERSIESAELEVFDLAVVLDQATAAYQDLDPDHVIRYQGPARDCQMVGAPDLLVQLLDKLVDNARDFTPGGETITLKLTPGPKEYLLQVINTGSRLPEDTSDLFDAFVTRRPQENGHLGQGLLMVRLISELHQGSISATNLPADQGACFSLRLPRPTLP